MSKKAFIIGINTLGLVHSENDAKLFKKSLENHDYEISIPNGTAKQDIMSELDDFFDRTNKTDTLIFYFSGHAYAPRGDLLLVINDDLSKKRSVINFSNVLYDIESCNASDKLIILDCCQANTAIQNWEPQQSDRFRMLTAIDRLEKAKEIVELEASFLTYHLSQCLLKPPPEIVDSSNSIRINQVYRYIEKVAKTYNKTNEIQVPIPNLLGNHKSNIKLSSVNPQSIVTMDNQMEALPVPFDVLDELNSFIEEYINSQTFFELSDSSSENTFYDIFVEPEFSTKSEHEKKTDFGNINYIDKKVINKKQTEEESLKLWDLISNQENCFIVGKQESGKTTILNYMCHKAIKRVLKSTPKFFKLV
jgi:hypothetical protein